MCENKMKEWTVDEVVRFQRPAARCGQGVNMSVYIKYEFLAEFTGSLRNKLRVCGKWVDKYWGTPFSDAERVSEIYSNAGKEAREEKARIRENVAEAIGFLKALPIDPGEPGDEE